jgi:hypothetical protein
MQIVWLVTIFERRQRLEVEEEVRGIVLVEVVVRNLVGDRDAKENGRFVRPASGNISYCIPAAAKN